MTIGKLLNHKFHTYSEQSCCTGPLTKMGLGNENSLSEFTNANLNLRKNNEKIILTSCNGCYSYIIKSQCTTTGLEFTKNHEIEDSEVSIINNKPFIMHAIEYISAWRVALQKFIAYPLNNIDFALHYGCHYMNQYKLSGDLSFRKIYTEKENEINWQYNSIPPYLEDVIVPLGGNVKEYSESILCCGGSTPQRQINLDNALLVAEKKFDSLHSIKPDVILTICPLCMYFMEESQCSDKLSKKFDDKIPIIHINELMGLMLGNDELIPLIDKSHKISLQPLIEKIVVK